jgi:hypothetical protein
LQIGQRNFRFCFAIEETPGTGYRIRAIRS